jgi:DnaJ family protein A protein 2
MTKEFTLESVDPTREAQRARGMAMDDDGDDMHPGAERVQCASQ